MHPISTAKAESTATEPAVSETLQKESDVMEILSIAVSVFLTDYFRMGFEKWFGISSSAAIALGVFLAFTVSWFVHRPKKIFRRFEATTGNYFVGLAVLATAIFIIGRIMHF
jgi:hypothetical protein